ncbi:MAG: DUF4870 domain-containing protein [Nocardioidaceae bacterium]
MTPGRPAIPPWPGGLAYPRPPAPPPMRPAEAQVWAICAHLGSLLLGFVAPLVAMIVIGERSPLARRHAVASLNFQVSLLIYGVGGVLIAVGAVVLATADPFALVGTLLLVGIFVAAGIAVLILVVVGSVRASQGMEFRYPLAIPFVR